MDASTDIKQAWFTFAGWALVVVWMVLADQNTRSGWDMGIQISCNALGYQHGERDDNWHPVCWNDAERVPLSQITQEPR